MQIYVGITDYNWFQFLKERKSDEVNFWKPGSQPFKALQENDLFLFKLHAPQNYIVGGGYFVKYSLLPILVLYQNSGYNENRAGAPACPGTERQRSKYHEDHQRRAAHHGRAAL